jgi:hypothetical protein
MVKSLIWKTLLTIPSKISTKTLCKIYSKPYKVKVVLCTKGKSTTSSLLSSSGELSIGYKKLIELKPNNQI